MVIENGLNRSRDTPRVRGKATILPLSKAKNKKKNSTSSNMKDIGQGSHEVCKYIINKHQILTPCRHVYPSVFSSLCPACDRPVRKNVNLGFDSFRIQADIGN